MKPGIKTTEFWVTAVLIALTLASAVLGEMDAEWAVSLAAVLGLAYKVGRVLIKMRGVDTADADALRDTIREEIRFVLSEKRPAEPSGPG